MKVFFSPKNAGHSTIPDTRIQFLSVSCFFYLSSLVQNFRPSHGRSLQFHSGRRRQLAEVQVQRSICDRSHGECQVEQGGSIFNYQQILRKLAPKNLLFLPFLAKKMQIENIVPIKLSYSSVFLPSTSSEGRTERAPFLPHLRSSARAYRDRLQIAPNQGVDCICRYFSHSFWSEIGGMFFFSIFNFLKHFEN